MIHWLCLENHLSHLCSSVKWSGTLSRVSDNLAFKRGIECRYKGHTWNKGCVRNHLILHIIKYVLGIRMDVLGLTPMHCDHQFKEEIAAMRLVPIAVEEEDYKLYVEEDNSMVEYMQVSSSYTLIYKDDGYFIDQ